MESQRGRPQSLDREPSNSSRPTSPSAAMVRDTATEAVFIDEPKESSSSSKGKQKLIDANDSVDIDKGPKQHRASISGKRLSGRPSLEPLISSKRQSLVGTPSVTALLAAESESTRSQTAHRRSRDSLVTQISEWIKQERKRRAAKRANRKVTDTSRTPPVTGKGVRPASPDEERASMSSEGSVALEHLTNILERTMSLKSNEASPRKRRLSHGQKLAALLKRGTTASSDTDYFDGEPIVPSCEVVLDNSRTVAYSGGTVEPDVDVASPAKGAPKDKEAWATFKFEIVRLTHTLRLKGWRRVSLERSSEIEVERLSGALTNAVYVVSPPRDLNLTDDWSGKSLPAPKNPPPKLLLRIYGPQVEHLIDREAELQILRRLARKRIGPRLLGTFTNGRFEEFFHAETLTPQDLRIPETSKQIAKRMRELHEGIELEKKEREDGPFVWLNWEKWVDRCEQIVRWLDEQVVNTKTGGDTSTNEKWKRLGLVCGVEWPIFRQMVEKYRLWLEEQYGGAQRMNERLVFAHNDTQYGNILRLMPAGESPLLLPANEHKRLIVIDFEYANANLPGLEFANHFTEWCYNYHDPATPYACNTGFYPKPEEQHRFICAYLQHNPAFKFHNSASNPPTPHLGPLPTSGSMTSLTATAPSSSISAFMLDSRAPPGAYAYHEQEAERERRVEEEAQRLMAETRIWRLANSAQWVAWGIVQANIPGLPDFEMERKKKIGGDQEDKAADDGEKLNDSNSKSRDGHEEGDVEEQAGVEEFDYLAYAQERAMFAWGDAIKLGIVKEEELPAELIKKVKIVEY